MGELLFFPHTKFIKRPKGKTIKIEPVASRKCMSMIESHFADSGLGIEYILGAFHELYFNSIKNIKSYFTEKELSKILTSMNGVILTTEGFGKTLIDEIKITKDCECKDIKRNLEASRIREKLKNCSRLERGVLEIWAHGFWTSSKKYKRTKDMMQKHISILI